MATSQTRALERAFSLNTQSNIRTAVTSAKINKKRPFRSYSRFTQGFPAKISDRDWLGKGHNFSTFSDAIQRMVTIPDSGGSASNLEALWAIAMVMGGLSSSGSSPEFTHTLTFQDIATNKFVKYTSMLEKQGDDEERLLTGAFIASVTLTGDRNDHVQLSYSGGGRVLSDSVISMPSVTAVSFFKTLFGTVTFGASGSETSISNEVLGWTISINQNPEPFFLMGNTAGEEDQLTEVHIGQQSVSGSITLKVNKTHRDKLINQTQVGLTIVAKSSDTISGGSSKHTMTISLPNIILSEESFGEEQSTASLTLSFGEEAVLKTVSQQPITVAILTDIPSTDLLVNA